MQRRRSSWQSVPVPDPGGRHRGCAVGPTEDGDMRLRCGDCCCFALFRVLEVGGDASSAPSMC